MARECQNSVALLLCYGAVSSMELENRVRIMASLNVLYNGNGDSNENLKNQQNKIFHVHHPFLYFFFISHFVEDVNTR